MTAAPQDNLSALYPAHLAEIRKRSDDALADAQGSWIVYTPGARPKLVFLQPHDYWHVVPAAPAGYWVEHFDIVTIRTPEQARAHLPGDPGRCAIVGETNVALAGFVPDNPAA